MLNFRNYGRVARVYGKSVLRYGTPKRILNALRTEWAYRRRQVNVDTYPYVLFLEPLYYCNLACPLCDRETFSDARFGRDELRKMPLDLLDRVLDEIGEYLFQCHIFGLGEPLLDWPRTQAVIARCRAKRIFSLVSTNCTLVTPQLAEQIVASPLDHLVCAIDGVSQQAYSAYRVGGEAEKALAGLRHLAQAKRARRSRLTIEWQFLVNRFNQHELGTAKQLAAELGVVFRPVPLGGVEHDQALRDYWLPSGDAYRDAAVAEGEVRHPWHCYWLWRAIVINSNGQLARCPGFQSVCELGDLRTRTVHDLYDGPVTRQARRLFRADAQDSNATFPEPCNSCGFYTRCHGGPVRSKPDIAADLQRERSVRTSPPLRVSISPSMRSRSAAEKIVPSRTAEEAADA